MGTENLERSIKSIFEEGKYIVPLYQRNYAWRKEEIEQLLQDVYEAYKKNPSGNYFIGSLVVLKRQNGDFEVIDGQQRLTTLSLITKILDISKSPCLFYDSRPEVDEFFKEFYSKYNVESDEFNTAQELKDIDYPQTVHLKNAIDFILEANLDPDSKKPLTIRNLDKKEQFINYFSDHVIIIRVEIPGDTDVASYFEIMNNRGVQLKKHEILKSLLMTKLSTEVEQVEFAKIWDACSQMDVPIQRLFNVEDRRKYFGESYDEFNYAFPESTQFNEDKGNNSGDYCIDEILSPDFDKGNTNNCGNNSNDEEEEYSEYKSIIDFPNFLMHVLKIQYNSYFKSSAVKAGDSENEKNDIPLNEKYLLSVYDKIKDKVDGKEFIKLLFYCRAVFDRYIIKTIIDENEEDEIRWTLRKPTKNDSSWRFCDTFGKTTNEESSEESSEKSFEQKRIVKALSMLQVTFRSRIYKNWLYEVLNWFWTRDDGKAINVTFEEYIKKLDELILHCYDEREIDVSNSSDEMYSLGTNTPHFIFNFIDYLYWVDSKKKEAERINQKYEIKDFDFKYWNSVEHHLARGLAERQKLKNMDASIDSLGNLCLISKSSNSRLSDRDVKEKVQSFFGDTKVNMGPKRRIMYEMTKKNDNEWGDEQIKEHYNDVIKLIEERKRILGIDQQNELI
ncbi:MAG: DUF262 domain-containing protein [Treponema sp.]|nr:DUF262 domain-containing protein [Treponema sp.]